MDAPLEGKAPMTQPRHDASVLSEARPKRTMFEGGGHGRVRSAPAPAGLPISHGAENVGAVDWTAQNWNDLIPRLYLVAFWRLKRVRGAIRCAVGADDLVNDAIAKTIGGARIWSQENCTLFQHLAGVIISDISHLTTSLEARLTVVREGNGGASWPPDVADETPNQEQIQESRSEQQGLLNHLRRVDPKIARMAELTLLHDITNTENFCRLLELAPPEVAKLRRRMRRGVRAYHAENRS